MDVTHIFGSLHAACTAQVPAEATPPFGNHIRPILQHGRTPLLVSAEITPLEMPSKIDTWVYVAVPINAEPKNKKARIYAGFGAFSAFEY
jgi:hypothetical protein